MSLLATVGGAFVEGVIPCGVVGGLLAPAAVEGDLGVGVRMWGRGCDLSELLASVFDCCCCCCCPSDRASGSGDLLDAAVDLPRWGLTGVKGEPVCKER